MSQVRWRESWPGCVLNGKLPGRLRRPKADLAQTRKDLRQLALEVHGLTTCDKAGEVLPLKSVDPP
jgi:hypothetical protein